MALPDLGTFDRMPFYRYRVDLRLERALRLVIAPSTLRATA